MNGSFVFNIKSYAKMLQTVHVSDRTTINNEFATIDG